MAIGSSAWAVTGENFEWHGYMRTGAGSNTKGGDQYCFNQHGIPGNEFRLGNECSIYGENLFQAYTPHAKTATGEFFRANFDFSYNPEGKDLSEPPNFNVFGAYVEAGRLSGGDEIVWVGKRYYRDTDIHMDDFFYFADTSGSGAGIEDIPLAHGKFNFAILMADETKTDSLNGGTSTSPIETENGRPRTILFDARLFEVKLTDHHYLNFWGGFATSTGGTDVNTGANYDNAHGEVFGVKEQYQTNAGYNRAAVLYGRGLLQGMNLNGTFGADPTQLVGQNYEATSHRWRLVDEFTFQPLHHFAVAFATIYENWNDGSPGAANGRWISVGARPIYFFNDNYSVAFELGGSNVKQSGINQNSGTMARATIAPQITPTADFFARPALRTFLTDTFGSMYHGISYGFQAEVWF